MILVYWVSPDGVTPQQAVSQVGTTDDAWYRETSYGQMGLTATATPWLKIDAPAACDDIGTIRESAAAAAVAAGYDPTAFDHDMVYMPCSGFSWGSVGGPWTWISAGGMTLYGTVHELGHNLGLDHAKSLTCRDASGNPVAVSDDCTLAEYGDWFDIMGGHPAGDGSSGGHFSAPHKEELGWLAGRWASVTATASYVLPPLENGAGGVQALHISTATRDYWLEYRQPVGNDSAFAGYPGITNGLLVHLDFVNTTQLVDMTPGSAGRFFDAALPIGDTWSDPEGTFTLSVGTPRAAGLPVTVTWLGSCTIRGTSGNDTLYGTSGNDTICGLGGDDKIYASAGTDEIDGGTGTDTLTYINAPAGVNVDLYAETGSGWGTQQIAGIENVTGSKYVDDLGGDAGNNVLAGYQGNDKVAGKEGADTETGGAGNDTLFVLSGDDVLDGSTGTDTVSFAGSTVPVTVNLGTGTASGPGVVSIVGVERVAGSKYADTITGSNLANVLSGAAGNDKIYAIDRISGNDKVDGGSGTDTCSADPGDTKVNCP